MGVLRFSQLNFDDVSLLMFHNLQTAVSDVPSVGRYAGFNLVLIPRLDMNIGVPRLDAQIWLTAQVVRLHPIVGVSESCKDCDREDGNEQKQVSFAHDSMSPALGRTRLQTRVTPFDPRHLGPSSQTLVRGFG